MISYAFALVVNALRMKRRRPRRRSTGTRKMPRWIYPGVGKIDAWTRSEARAFVKKHLGVERLPAGKTCMLISKGDPKEKRR